MRRFFVTAALLVTLALLGGKGATRADAGIKACPGDCQGDFFVTIEDLRLAVQIALGIEPTSACLAAGSGADGRVTIDDLVSAVQTDAQKLELYTASRLTIDPDTRVERGYLDLLAGRLKLPDALIDHVEATVSAAKSPASVPSVPASAAPNSPW